MDITVNRENNRAYTAMFDELIQRVFGFSFGPWLERNLWDERYESYSIIENGEMLANLCIYKTDLLVSGQPFHAHQFGAVATLPEKRGKGLSRALMNHVLELYPGTPAFLAANPSVIDFYPIFEFRQIKTFNPIVDIAVDNLTNSDNKLELDDKLVQEMLYRKRIYSNIMDSVNTQSIQIFHLLMEYSDCIYHLPDCNAIVIARQDGNTLFCADVITEQKITIGELVRELPFSGVSRIKFGFCPDWLGVDFAWEQVDSEKEPYFIFGDWNLPEKFRFPAMSET